MAAVEVVRAISDRGVVDIADCAVDCRPDTGLGNGLAVGAGRIG